MKYMKNSMIYLDNAATSFPKPDSVISETVRCLRHYAANPGRSGHRLSVKASEAVYSVREKISALVDWNVPEHVVFTSGATFAINLAMKSTVRQGSHILISDMEHNSVLRAAVELKEKRGVDFDIFNSSELQSDITSKIKENTTHVVSTLMSNVNGARIDAKILSDLCNEKGLGLILDASQLLGHEKFSLKDIKFTALCCAGHKALFGMEGVGFVIFGDSEVGDGIVFGGSGTDSKNPHMPILLPDKFEAGTLPLPAIVSLGAGIDFINSCGVEKISSRIFEMTERLRKEIKALSRIEFCEGEGGIISFTSFDIESEALSEKLDEFGICVRGGFHCAPLMHKKLGTYENGTVRASLSYFNTDAELEYLISALTYITKKS